MAAMLAALLLTACRAGDATPSRGAADLLVRHFEAVAFHDQYDTAHAIDRVRKWTGPIRISLSGEGSAPFRSAIGGYAAELAELTGLSIRFAEPTRETANFEIRFVHWDDMEQAARAFAPRPDWLSIIVEGAACLFIYRRTGDYRIVRALVLVSTRERDADKAACLLEEMTQALGLPNDSDVVQPSIFNRRDRLTALASADRLLVRTLYDPRITAGMARTEALARARVIIGELQGRSPGND